MHLATPDAKIYVAGHQGMVGQAIWRQFQDAGYANLVGRTSEELDLRDPHATRAFFETEQPDFVVPAAVRVGGILAHNRFPADVIGDTLVIEQSVIQAAHEATGAASDGADAPVTLWGSGTPRQEFLHVEDLADAVRFVLETPEDEIREVAPDGILNVGVGDDRSINDLMALIQDVVGHDGPVKHDESKPDGTPRTLVDTSRMDALGWTAQMSPREDLEKVNDWYRAHEDELVAA